MKHIKYSVLVLMAAVLVGCSTTPTKFDTTVANVETNYVPKLVLQTNVVTLLLTNNVVSYQTNVVVATNLVPIYTLTPNQWATNVSTVAGTVGNTFLPGSGGLITSGLLGLLSIFLGWRNRQMSGQNSTLSQAAGSLAQIIETAREVMSSTPQGQKAADAFTQWMLTHQAQAGTIAEITKIVKDSTDNVQAQAAANQILALMGQPPAALRSAS